MLTFSGSNYKHALRKREREKEKERERERKRERERERERERRLILSDLGSLSSVV